MSSEPFSVDLRQVRDVHVVTLAGELDLATGQGLPDVLADVAGPTVVVDLASLTFIDSSGIGALARARQRISARGSSMILSRPQPRVAKTLEIMGLANWITPWSDEWE